MPRKVLPPGFRFNDVAPIWFYAERTNSAKYDCGSESKAVNVCHRLNMYRKLIREQDPNGITNLDNFVVQRYGSYAIIAPRQSFDESRLESLEGIEPPQIEPLVEEEMTPKRQRERDRAIEEYNRYLREEGRPVVDFQFEKESEIRDDIETKKVKE